MRRSVAVATALNAGVEFFLFSPQDKHVPSALRSGVVTVELAPPSASGGGGGQPPPTAAGAAVLLPAEATESQAWAALGGLDAPVLRLSDAAGAFCSFDKPKDNEAFDWQMGLALNGTWCCSKSGSVVFDLPEPLAASSRAGAGAGASSQGGGAAAGGDGSASLCVPRVPGTYPSVIRAMELQKARGSSRHVESCSNPSADELLKKSLRVSCTFALAGTQTFPVCCSTICCCNSSGRPCINCMAPLTYTH